MASWLDSLPGKVWFRVLDAAGIVEVVTILRCGSLIRISTESYIRALSRRYDSEKQDLWRFCGLQRHPAFPKWGLGSEMNLRWMHFLEAKRAARQKQRRTGRLAVGSGWAAAVTSHGKRLAVVGRNGSGQLGTGVYDSLPQPALTGHPRRAIAAVSAGPDFLACLTAEGGTVLTAGANGRGQLGHGRIGGVSPELAPLASRSVDERITSIACGDEFLLMCSETGVVFVCGAKEIACLDRRVPLKTVSDTGHPLQVPLDPTRKVEAIAAGAEHAVLLDNGGQMFTWGKNIFGQLGLGDRERRLVPELVKVPGDELCVAVAAGGNHSAAVTEFSRALIWGGHLGGCRGSGGENSIEQPRRLNLPHAVERVICRPSITLCLGGGTLSLLGGDEVVAALRTKWQENLASLCTPPNTAVTFVEPTPPNTARVAAAVVAITVASVAVKAGQSLPDTAGVADTLALDSVDAVVVSAEPDNAEPQSNAEPQNSGNPEDDPSKLLTKPGGQDEENQQVDASQFLTTSGNQEPEMEPQTNSMLNDRNVNADDALNSVPEMEPQTRSMLDDRNGNADDALSSVAERNAPDVAEGAEVAPVAADAAKDALVADSPEDAEVAPVDEDVADVADDAPVPAPIADVPEDPNCKVEEECPVEEISASHEAAKKDLLKVIMEMNMDYGIQESSDGSVILRPPAPLNAEHIVDVEASSGEAGGFAIILWDNDFASVLGDGLAATSPLRLWSLQDGISCVTEHL